MSLIRTYIESRTWAILEEYLQLMGAIADRDLQARDAWVKSIEREFGHPVAGTVESTVRNGVAVIPVAGPLFRYGNLFTQISGATSMERLAADIGTVMRDDSIQAVIYDINSPGGEVDGVAETAEIIKSYRGVKPQTAFVSHLGTSAAYWLAAATDRVVVDKTAMVGSIGAVLSVVDTSARDEEMGIKRMEFVSSVSPDKRVNPFSEDADEATRAKAKIQGLVDRIGQVFVEVVAGYRGMGEDEITRHRGGLLLGSDAVLGGLADSVGTLEGLIEAHGGGQGAAANHLSLAATSGLDHTALESDSMSEKISTDEVQIDLDFLSSNHPDLLAEIEEVAASAERDRILKIHALDAAGFEDLKLGGMQDPNATAGDIAKAILEAKGEQERQRVQSVEASLDQDEDDIQEVASASLPVEEEPTEEQIAASVRQYLPG
jgi:ClpP class serine protease